MPLSYDREGLSLTADVSVKQRFLDTLRLAEAAGLVAMSPLLVTTMDVPGGVLAGLALSAAVIIRPRARRTTLTRAQQQQQLVTSLINEALELRAAYVAAKSQAFERGRFQSFFESGRELIRWVDKAGDKIAVYPEFRGIFGACDDSGGLLEALDRRIQRLSQIRRLAEKSHRLNLPI